MRDVIRLLDYWRKHPPLHILAAAALGLETAGAAGEPVTRPDRLVPFLGAPEKPPAHIRGLIDWAEQMKAKIPQPN